MKKRIMQISFMKIINDNPADFIGDYRSKFKEIVDILYENKYKTTRNQRMWIIKYYTDKYVVQTNSIPEISDLDRLASLILDEEITDTHPDKMTLNEYPIMSATQREERVKNEISIKWAEEVGTDGRDYRPMTRGMNRKMRDVTNGHLRDEDVHARNKERRKRYRDFTKVQPVISYNLREN